MANGNKILLICDDENISRFLREKLMVEGGYSVSSESVMQEGLALFRQNGFDIIIAKINPDDPQTKEFVKAVKKIDPETIIILFIDEYTPEVEGLFKLGVYDYIAKPINSEKLAFLIKKGLELRTFTGVKRA